MLGGRPPRGSYALPTGAIGDRAAPLPAPGAVGGGGEEAPPPEAPAESTNRPKGGGGLPRTPNCIT